jgi:hypothetical protein
LEPVYPVVRDFRPLRQFSPVRVRRNYPIIPIQRRCPPPCLVDSPFVVATIHVPSYRSPNYIVPQQFCPPPSFQPNIVLPQPLSPALPNITKKKKLFKCRRNKQPKANKQNSSQTEFEAPNFNTFPNLAFQPIDSPSKTKKKKDKKQKNTADDLCFNSDSFFPNDFNWFPNWQQASFPQETKKAKKNRKQKNKLQNPNWLDDSQGAQCSDWLWNLEQNFPQETKKSKKNKKQKNTTGNLGFNSESFFPNDFNWFPNWQQSDFRQETKQSKKKKKQKNKSQNPNWLDDPQGAQFSDWLWN